MVVLSAERTDTITTFKKMLSPTNSPVVISPRSIDEISVLDTFIDYSDKQLTDFPSLNCEVTHLRLDNNLLADLSNFSLPNFSLLTVLDLSYNKLTELPAVFSQLINLKELFISHNKISLLTDTLSNLIQLEILDISYNQLLGIDDTVCKLTNLHHLDVRNNQLESLPYSLGVLESRLFTLLIDNNPYSQEFLELASPLLASDYTNPINKDTNNSKTGTNRWRKFRSAMRKSISLDPNSNSSLQNVFRNMTGRASEENLDPSFTNLNLEENKETRRTKKHSSHSITHTSGHSYQTAESDINGKANNSSPQVPTKNPRRYVRSTASALDNGVMERQAFDNRRCQTLDGFVFISDNSNLDTLSQHSSDFELDNNGVRTPSLKKLGYSQLGDQNPNHNTSPNLSKLIQPLPELPPTGERSPLRPSKVSHSKQNSYDSTTSCSPLPPKPNQLPASPLDKPLPPTGDLLRDSGYSTDTPNKLSVGVGNHGHRKKLSNHINDKHPDLPPLPQEAVPRPSTDDKREEWHSDGLALPPPPLPLPPPPPKSPALVKAGLTSPPPPNKPNPITISSVANLNSNHSNGVEHWPSISVGAHLLPPHSALVDFLRHLRDRWDLSPASSEAKEVQQRRRNGHGYILKQNLSEEAETELLPKEGDPENINKRRRNILNEILHTEETYVKSLSALVEIYKRGSAEKGIFTPEETRMIFGNVESILQFHNQFLLPEIRKTMQLPEPLMGSVFEQHSAYLKMYSLYVNDFDVANVEVERLMALGTTSTTTSNLVSSISNMSGIGGSITSRLGKRKIKTFLEQCRQHPNHNQLNLQGFLLLPVQRIPRYRLLLQDLLKYTPLEHPDRPSLIKGYIAIALRAEEINERKRVKESNDKVLEIQNRIKGNSQVPLVEPHRRFIKEGILHLRQVVSIRHRTLQSNTSTVTTPTASFAAAGLMSSPPHLPSSPSTFHSNEQATTLKTLEVNHDLLYFLFNDIMIQCKLVGKDIELHRVLELGSKLKPARLVNAQILRVVDNRSIYYFMGKTEELVSWANAINSR